ncbi:MAG TPA: hypothetical protein ENI50_01935, partial [Euryarchaeota archaeon]|nr:hypothetical protein [Euryarchaeota archaeon]
MKKIGIAIVIVMFLSIAGNFTIADENVAIVVSDNCADHAIAEVLSEQLNASIVTVEWGYYDESILQRIMDLNVSKVIIIGGPKAVVIEIEMALSGVVEVERIGGEDRAETVAMICEEYSFMFKERRALVVQGNDEKGLKDAVEKAKICGCPLFIIEDNEVPECVMQAMEKMGINDIELIQTPNMDVEHIQTQFANIGCEKVQLRGVPIKERTEEEINEAEEKISEAENLEAQNDVAVIMIEKAKEFLETAKALYNEGYYGEAFGYAVSAKILAENAIKVIEHSEKDGHGQGNLGEKAENMLTQVSSKISDMETEIQSLEPSDNTTEIENKFNEIKAKLEEAKTAFDSGDYEKCIEILEEIKNMIPELQQMINECSGGEDHGDDDCEKASKKIQEAGVKIAHVQMKIYEAMAQGKDV